MTGPEARKAREEAKVLGADDRAQNLEYQLFQKLRDETLREIEPIQQTADAIAVLDVLCALAETARLFRYCRPELNNSLRLVIKDGRHPVLDRGSSFAIGRILDHLRPDHS